MEQLDGLSSDPSPSYMEKEAQQWDATRLNQSKILFVPFISKVP